MSAQEITIVIGAIATATVSIIGAIFAGIASIRAKKAETHSAEAKEYAKEATITTKALVDVVPDAPDALSKRIEDDATNFNLLDKK